MIELGLLCKNKAILKKLSSHDLLTQNAPNPKYFMAILEKIANMEDHDQSASLEAV